MKANTRRSFYYHADASALGGEFRRPLERVISAPASVSLAQAGGYNARKDEKYHLDGLVSYEAAHVSVSGREFAEDGGWRSNASTIVDGLNIFNVVTADRVVSQLSVMHFYDDRPAEVSFNGSQFVNLRLNGQPIATKWNNALLDRDGIDKAGGAPWQDNLPRFEDLLGNAERQYNDLSRQDEAKKLPSRLALTNPREAMSKRGSYVCSLVGQVEVEAPVTTFAHQIHVPDFGNIFLGELRANLFFAQLTMVRVEMGSAGDGNVSGGTSTSNGRPMP